ncbi:signal peptidase I [Nocardioides xinjiangensis]|uniref:signal peptidase I n=1 Tax=Nocardioides xinjiangensis TaxID=2817376 RepID=UPI001B30B2F7|nr:signal peptidase I [Nocardioides sp. SYSU D00778]
MTRVRHALLTASAVLGCLCLLATVCALAFDVRPIVFRSGSMSPTIPTGALAWVHRVDAADIAAGDVVAVTTTNGARVTHRVVGAALEGDVATLRLQGDANRVPDPQPYHVTAAERVVLDVPWLGYALGWLGTGAGRFALLLYGACLLHVALRPSAEPPVDAVPAASPVPHPRADAGRGRRGPLRVLTLAVLLIAGAATGVTHSAPGWASWTDTVALSGTSLRAHAVLPPPSVSCAGGGLLEALTYSWPDQDPRYGYRVRLTDAQGMLHGADRVVAPRSGTTTYSVAYAAADLPLGGFTVRVSAFLADSPSWASSTGTVATGRKSLLGLGLTTTCS